MMVPNQMTHQSLPNATHRPPLVAHDGAGESEALVSYVKLLSVRSTYKAALLLTKSAEFEAAWQEFEAADAYSLAPGAWRYLPLLESDALDESVAVALAAIVRQHVADEEHLLLQADEPADELRARRADLERKKRCECRVESDHHRRSPLATHTPPDKSLSVSHLSLLFCASQSRCRRRERGEATAIAGEAGAAGCIGQEAGVHPRGGSALRLPRDVVAVWRVVQEFVFDAAATLQFGRGQRFAAV